MFKNVPKGKVSKTYPSSYTARILPTLAGVGNILLILLFGFICCLLTYNWDQSSTQQECLKMGFITKEPKYAKCRERDQLRASIKKKSSGILNTNNIYFTLSFHESELY